MVATRNGSGIDGIDLLNVTTSQGTRSRELPSMPTAGAPLPAPATTPAVRNLVQRDGTWDATRTESKHFQRENRDQRLAVDYAPLFSVSTGGPTPVADMHKGHIHIPMDGKLLYMFREPGDAGKQVVMDFTDERNRLKGEDHLKGLWQADVSKDVLAQLDAMYQNTRMLLGDKLNVSQGIIKDMEVKRGGAIGFMVPNVRYKLHIVDTDGDGHISQGDVRIVTKEYIELQKQKNGADYLAKAGVQTPALMKSDKMALPLLSGRETFAKLGLTDQHVTVLREADTKRAAAAANGVSRAEVPDIVKQIPVPPEPPALEEERILSGTLPNPPAARPAATAATRSGVTLDENDSDAQIIGVPTGAAPIPAAAPPVPAPSGTSSPPEGASAGSETSTVQSDAPATSNGDAAVPAPEEFPPLFTALGLMQEKKRTETNNKDAKLTTTEVAHLISSLADSDEYDAKKAAGFAGFLSEVTGWTPDQEIDLANDINREILDDAYQLYKQTNGNVAAMQEKVAKAKADIEAPQPPATESAQGATDSGNGVIAKLSDVDPKYVVGAVLAGGAYLVHRSRARRAAEAAATAAAAAAEPTPVDATPVDATATAAAAEPTPAEAAAPAAAASEAASAVSEPVASITQPVLDAELMERLVADREWTIGERNPTQSRADNRAQAVKEIKLEQGAIVTNRRLSEMLVAEGFDAEQIKQLIADRELAIGRRNPTQGQYHNRAQAVYELALERSAGAVNQHLNQVLTAQGMDAEQIRRLIADREFAIGEQNRKQGQFLNRAQALNELLAETTPAGARSAAASNPAGTAPSEPTPTPGGSTPDGGATPSEPAPAPGDSATSPKADGAAATADASTGAPAAKPLTVSETQELIRTQLLEVAEAQKTIQQQHESMLKGPRPKTPEEARVFNEVTRELSARSGRLEILQRELSAQLETPRAEIERKYGLTFDEIQAQREQALKVQADIDARRSEIRQQLAQRPGAEKSDALAKQLQEIDLHERSPNQLELAKLDSDLYTLEVIRRNEIEKKIKEIAQELKNKNLKPGEEKKLRSDLRELQHAPGSGKHAPTDLGDGHGRAVTFAETDARLEAQFQRLDERAKHLAAEKAALESSHEPAGSSKWTDYERRKAAFDGDLTDFNKRDGVYDGHKAQHEAAKAGKPVGVTKPTAGGASAAPAGAVDLPLTARGGTAGGVHADAIDGALARDIHAAPAVDLPLNSSTPPTGATASKAPAEVVQGKFGGTAEAPRTSPGVDVHANAAVNTGFAVYSLWNRWRNSGDDFADKNTRTSTAVGFASDVTTIASGFVKRGGGALGGSAIVASTGVDYYNAAKSGDATRAATAAGGLGGAATGVGVTTFGIGLLTGLGLISGVGTIPTLLIVGGSTAVGAYYGAKKGSQSQWLKDHYSQLFGVDDKLAEGLAAGVDKNLTPQLDKNKDGKIGLDELKAGLEQRGITAVRQIDVNKDGKTSTDELNLALRFNMARNAQMVPEAAKQVLAGQREDGRVFSYDEIVSRDKGSNQTYAIAPDNGIIMMTNKMADGKYEMKIYKATEGGYVMASDGYKVSANPNFSHILVGEDGKKFKFDVRAESGQRILDIYEHREAMKGKYGVPEDGYARVGHNSERVDSFNSAAKAKAPDAPQDDQAPTIGVPTGFRASIKPITS